MRRPASAKRVLCEPGRSDIFGSVVLLKLRLLWCWCFLMQSLSEASCGRKAGSVKVSPEILGLGLSVP